MQEHSTMIQGLKNVLSGRPGQVNFPLGQVTFHSQASRLPSTSFTRANKDLPSSRKI